MPFARAHHLYPPFAEGVPTAPLVSVSLAKLEADDVAESKAFFKASTELGFFYLNMAGSPLGEDIVSEAEKLHLLQHEFAQLPQEEKDRVARDKIDPFFGYHVRAQKRNAAGELMKDEIYNVSQGFRRLLKNC